MWEERYTPYGERLLQPAANDNHTGFTGHVEDAATGLTYMQARYYDPVFARFLSTDPVQFAPDRPDMFNRYAYAANDPVNMWDPDGRCSQVAGTFSMTCPARRSYETNPKLHNKITVAGTAAATGVAGAAVCVGGGCAGAAIFVGEVLSADALAGSGAAGLGATGTALGRSGVLDDVAGFMADNAKRIGQKIGAKLGDGRLPFDVSAEGAAQARGAISDTLSNPSAVSQPFETSGGNMAQDVFSDQTGMTVRVREDGTFDTLIPEKTDRFD